MARLMPPVSPCGPWPCSGTSTPTELALAAMTRLVALRSTTLTASSTIPTGSTTCSSPPPWEVANYEPRNPIESEMVKRHVQTRLERKRTGPEEWLVVTRRPLVDDRTWEPRASRDVIDQDTRYRYQYYLTPAGGSK